MQCTGEMTCYFLNCITNIKQMVNFTTQPLGKLFNR